MPSAERQRSIDFEINRTLSNAKSLCQFLTRDIVDKDRLENQPPPFGKLGHRTLERPQFGPGFNHPRCIRRVVRQIEKAIDLGGRQPTRLGTATVRGYIECNPKKIVLWTSNGTNLCGAFEP